MGKTMVFEDIRSARGGENTGDATRTPQERTQKEENQWPILINLSVKRDAELCNSFILLESPRGNPGREYRDLRFNR